jgi:hypothetical protein
LRRYAEISIAWNLCYGTGGEIEQILNPCILHGYWEIAFPQAIQLTITPQARIVSNKAGPPILSVPL